MTDLHAIVQLSKIAQLCAKYNNTAGYIALINLLFCLGLSMAYFAQKDYRRGFYFLFALLITLTVIL